MSTRGIIARAKADSFVGVFHHWDSYPEGLGKTLWDLYHGHFEKDLSRMLAFLIDEHPAGWETINYKDFSLKPGYADGLCTIGGCDRKRQTVSLHAYRTNKRLTQGAKVEACQILTWVAFRSWLVYGKGNRPSQATKKGTLLSSSCLNDRGIQKQKGF